MFALLSSHRLRIKQPNNIKHDLVQLKILRRIDFGNPRSTQLICVIFGNNSAHNQRDMGQASTLHPFQHLTDQRQVRPRQNRQANHVGVFFKRRFYNLLLGRYFKPVDEERIFVFVDMLGSSKAANELGNTRFHQLLSDFFFHIDRAIVRSGGEIVSYVGDAVIITWPLSDNMKKNAAPFRAIAEMLDLIDSQKDYFEREYGQVPQFRAALHCGAIVVGECGDSRRQITFLGDVVNVTARIEQASKDLDIQYLASADLIRRMHVPENVRATKHGPVNLKGVDGPVVLYDIEFCRDK